LRWVICTIIVRKPHAAGESGYISTVGTFCFTLIDYQFRAVLKTKTADTSRSAGFAFLPAGALPSALDAACKSSGLNPGLWVAILGFGVGVVSALDGAALGTG